MAGASLKTYAQPGGPLGGRKAALLALILIVGAALRFYGLYWGFPHKLHCDEATVLGTAQKLGRSFLQEGSLNPHFSVWGALPLYLVWLFVVPVKAAAAIAGQTWTTAQTLLVAGRTISAVADVFAIYLVFRLGALYSGRAGLAAAALYSVALLNVRESHFYSVDTLSSCLMLAYIWTCEMAARRPSMRSVLVCGCCLGLCLATKISALPMALLGLAIVAAMIQRGSGDEAGTDKSTAARTRSRVRWLAAIVAAAALAPCIAWHSQRDRIVGIADRALVHRVSPERLETHSSAFWHSQVQSIYDGMLHTTLAGGLAVALLSAVVFAVTRGERGKRVAGQIWRHLPVVLGFAGAAAGTFLLLNPYAVLAPAEYWLPSGPRSVTWAMLQAGGALHPPPGWTIQFVGTVPLLYHFMHVFPYAWGWPLTALLTCGWLCGLYWLTRRGPQPGRFVCASALVILLTLLALWMKMTRYIAPLTPILCVLAGAMLARGWASPRRFVACFAAAAFVLVWGFSLLWCGGYVSIYSQTDGRIAAARWLAQNAGEGDNVALEKDDAWGINGEEMLQQSGAFTVERYDPLHIMHDEMLTGPSPEGMARKRAYLGQRLANADYLVITDNNPGRLSALANQFPVMTGLYGQLIADEGQFQRVARLGPTWRFLGRAVDDSGSEPTFRLFDHPRVEVFRRKVPRGPAHRPAESKLGRDPMDRARTDSR